MRKNIQPSRRAFVLATALLGLGTSACNPASSNDRQLRFATLAAAQEELARLARASELRTGTAFNWVQTLVHCAQSIEFSMSGFPQPKSALFQRTAGAAAFGVFAWRGRMTHDLSEPIPGAPALEATIAPAQALARLHGAIRAFQAWSGPLQPHFAYGALDKKSYELAHAMHLANHLSAIA